MAEEDMNMNDLVALLEEMAHICQRPRATKKIVSNFTKMKNRIEELCADNYRLVNLELEREAERQRQRVHDNGL